MTEGQGAAVTRVRCGRCNLVSRLYSEESQGWLCSRECVLGTKTWTGSVWCEPSYKEATFAKRSCCGVPGGAGPRPEQTQPHPHGQPPVGGSTPAPRAPSHEVATEGLGPGKPPRLLTSFARSASDPSLSNSMRRPQGGGEGGGEGGGGLANAFVGAAVGAVVGALVGRHVTDFVLAHLLSPSSA